MAYGSCMNVLFVLTAVVLYRNVNGHDSWALTFDLGSGSKQCFYQKFTEVKEMTFEFEVIDGGNLDVDAKIESPNGKEVYFEERETEDVHDFTTSHGVYSFCFSNEFSTLSNKMVYFELRPEGHETLADRAGQKKPMANTQIEESMDHLFRNQEVIKRIQTVYRVQEARGRHLAEDLSMRVQVWSIGEALVVLIMGFGQVFMLKRFFADKPGTTTKPKKADMVQNNAEGYVTATLLKA